MNLDYDLEIEKFSKKLDDMQQLMNVVSDLNEKDQRFASDLIQTFTGSGALSVKQWEWVGRLAERGTAIEPLYGDFDAILVSFQLAGEHLKRPKVRLMTEGGRYVELRFFPDEDSRVVKVFVDGWQGHGYRKFAGTIEGGLIKPYSRDRLTDEVLMVIQELALDPLGTAKAMANKLGVCMYCGLRLSDEESKRRGYGPICAQHRNLPYGPNATFTAVA